MTDAIAVADDQKGSCQNAFASTTGMKPLNTSPVRVKKPASLPATLKTLEKPIFPLPFSRGSIPFKSLEKIKPKGIEPDR